MSDDLIKRLREGMLNNSLPMDCRKAAALIEQQAARIAELEAQIAVSNGADHAN